MRIAYIGQMADVSSENGIAKKIAMQTSAWRQAGHTVRYFSLAPTGTVWPGLAPLEVELFARDTGGSRFGRSRRLTERVRAWHPEAIYFRYAYHSPGLPALFREIPTIAEINSDDLREYPLTLDPVRVFYHRLTRARVLRRVAGFVPVTHELAERFAGWQRPAEVLGNGISLARFTALPPAPNDASPTLIFLGSAGSPWHGLERVAELARLLPDHGFEIVGIDRAAWDRQTSSATLPTNARLHGHLSHAQYAPLLARATAAIGSLALYKNGMEEACPLKVREYLALGLPVIAAYRDTDVPEGADYFLRLPNTADALAPEQARIAAFLLRWRGARVPRAAVAHLDDSVKETRRLAFIDRIRANFSSGR